MVHTYFIRVALVNIQADKIDTDTGDGTDSNVGWGIKEENSNENKS